MPRRGLFVLGLIAGLRKGGRLEPWDLAAGNCGRRARERYARLHHNPYNSNPALTLRTPTIAFSS